ncbi:MAG: DNA polymerase III subunit delta [Epsilonproteobacteria bacterium]|nr:DNA polymerase III subunit delta [Campylobacterota bacterium]
MYKAEFDRLLASNKIEKNFILFGESIFYIDYYTKLLSNYEDANKLSFYHDEYDFTQAKAHLSQASLFGGMNILVIKSEKKIPKKELETLFELSNKGDNRFIYAYLGSDHKSYNNAFKKFHVITVRFFHPKQGEAINILLQEAKQLELNIDSYTLAHLYNLHNNDLELALNELQKLSILKEQKITNKEIDTLVYGLGEVDLQSFLKLILEKKPYIHELQTLLEAGEDEIRLLTALTSYIQELYMFNTYIRAYGKADAKAILGYNPPQFIVDQKAQMAMRFKPQTYYKLLRFLLHAELEMKSSHVKNKAFLYSILAHIEQIL